MGMGMLGDTFSLTESRRNSLHIETNLVSYECKKRSSLKYHVLKLIYCSGGSFLKKWLGHSYLRRKVIGQPKYHQKSLAPQALTLRDCCPSTAGGTSQHPTIRPQAESPSQCLPSTTDRSPSSSHPQQPSFAHHRGRRCRCGIGCRRLGLADLTWSGHAFCRSTRGSRGS